MRVFILEDDPFIALDLQVIVESGGHQVIGVHASLAQARDHLADAFDFALLDVDLPDGKSFDLAAVLKERLIPFAFISGSQRGDLPTAFRDVRFIAKPYAESAVLQCLPRERCAAA
jgi:DNA-binding response OmpR family regulator